MYGTVSFLGPGSAGKFVHLSTNGIPIHWIPIGQLPPNRTLFSNGHSQPSNPPPTLKPQTVVILVCPRRCCAGRGAAGPWRFVTLRQFRQPSWVPHPAPLVARRRSPPNAARASVSGCHALPMPHATRRGRSVLEGFRWFSGGREESPRRTNDRSAWIGSKQRVWQLDLG